MTASNVPEPGPTVVPSARAERRRIFLNDISGVTLYVIGAGTFALLALALLLVAR
ncbi:MAG TPA: hypothetical protein VIN06_18420 [Devosia sp.]